MLENKIWEISDMFNLWKSTIASQHVINYYSGFVNFDNFFKNQEIIVKKGTLILKNGVIIYKDKNPYIEITCKTSPLLGSINNKKIFELMEPSKGLGDRASGPG